MPNNNQHPELEQDEIDAIRDVMQGSDADIDRYFLLKLQSAFLLCGYFSVQMLFFPSNVIFWLQVNQGANPDQIGAVLTYRGIFVLVYVGIAIVAWKSNRYTELVFGSAAVMASANFLFDIPYLWSAEYTTGLWGFAFAILIRVTIIALLISIFRNLHRATYLPKALLRNPFTYLKQ